LAELGLGVHVLDRSSLLDTGLERAAEVLGDITAPVMTRFYATCPEARTAFEHHGPGNPEKLEAEMVQNALYWTMSWLDRESEIRVHLGGSVPHHEDTLYVRPTWYRGLVEAVADVIAETIPADRPDELEIWREIRSGLGRAVDQSKSASPLELSTLTSSHQPAG
jgi:hypothetical protein